MEWITRRHVLTIAGLLVLLVLLLPPWVAYRPASAGYAGVSTSIGVRGGKSPDPGFRVPIGWHFILLAPEYKGDSISIDWSRIALELLLIGAATAVALYTLPGARHSAIAAGGA